MISEARNHGVIEMPKVTNNSELIDIFYTETQDLIDKIKQCLSDLTAGQEGQLSDRSAVLRDLFRCAHIGKSCARSVGFDDLESLADILERIFGKARDESIAMTADDITLLCEAAQACHSLLNKEGSIGCEDLLDRLNKIPELGGE